jgi:hypothetical protein
MSRTKPSKNIVNKLNKNRCISSNIIRCNWLLVRDIIVFYSKITRADRIVFIIDEQLAGLKCVYKEIFHF